MNANRKFKSLRLVRFGDVLFDQQRRLILLCRSCQRHYLTLEAFQTHLNKCSALKHIVTSIDELKYEEDKRKTRLINGKQELHIYEPNAVHNKVDNSIDWEAELEDPRWYTDDNRAQASKSKQPATNTKENVEKARTRYQTNKELDIEKQIKVAPGQQQEQFSLSPKLRMLKSPPKRMILTSQQQQQIRRITTETPKETMKIAPVENMVVDPCEEAMATDLVSSTTTAAAGPGAVTPMVNIPAAISASIGDTQHILNKLRACGVEVKRRSTRETPPDLPIDAVALSKKRQALEIMRKLQSNGIKCTKVKNARKDI